MIIFLYLNFYSGILISCKVKVRLFNFLSNVNDFSCSLEIWKECYNWLLLIFWILPFRVNVFLLILLCDFLGLSLWVILHNYSDCKHSCQAVYSNRCAFRVSSLSSPHLHLLGTSWFFRKKITLFLLSH